MTSTSSAAPADTERHLKHVRATGTWEGSMRTRLGVRRFDPFRTDEPEKVGGTDSAPTPMEYVIAALNGCLTVVIETVAHEHGVTLTSLALESVATMDTRGFAGTADVSPHFQDVRVDAVFGLSDPGAIDAIRTDVERRCPALNLIRDAGVPVELNWTVAGEGEGR